LVGRALPAAALDAVAPFRGLRELNVIHDALEDGAELAYEESVGIPAAQLASWLHRKEELAVFSQSGCRQGVPNYMPASVMKSLEEAGFSRKDIEGDA
jgi:hypothetical protein